MPRAGLVAAGCRAAALVHVPRASIVRGPCSEAWRPGGCDGELRIACPAAPFPLRVFAGPDLPAAHAAILRHLGWPNPPPPAARLGDSLFCTWTPYPRCLTRERILEFARDIRATGYPCSVLDPGVNRRDVRLPAGQWVDLWSGREYSGGWRRGHPAPCPGMPLFVRAERGDLVARLRPCLAALRPGSVPAGVTSTRHRAGLDRDLGVTG